MSDYIDANELFKQKQKLLDELYQSNLKYVCDIIKKDFSKHLLAIIEHPIDAGVAYFSLKINDISSSNIISFSFIRDNIKYFEQYVNHEFKSFNYDISLNFLDITNTLMARYKPLEVKSKKRPFWKFFFRDKTND